MAMREYHRDGDEYEDFDEYEEEDDNQEEEAGEDEYEAEEVRQPTEQELEYLELRQRLKESIRKQMKKDSGASLSSSQEKKNKLPYDNYGSFFGPSQPVIAQRVIEESRSLLENPHLAERISKPKYSNNKVHALAAPQGSRPQVNGHPPKMTSAQKAKTKVEMLKNTRDYSFLLSDDAEVPAPKKDPPPRSVDVRKPEVRLAQEMQKCKLSSNNEKKVPNGRDERRTVPAARQIQSKMLPPKTKTSVDHRDRQGSNTEKGNGRPQVSKSLSAKVPMTSTGKKIIAPSAKNGVAVVRKSLLSKPQTSVPKQAYDQRRELKDSGNAKLLSRQSVGSKSQVKHPQGKVPSRVTSQQDRPKEKERLARRHDDEDDEDAFSMLRQMLRYDPRRYADDDDDRDMEASFDEIQKEERRSKQIAIREDEEELRKIEEEERRERMRKAKKRKVAG